MKTLHLCIFTEDLRGHFDFLISINILSLIKRAFSFNCLSSVKYIEFSTSFDSKMYGCAHPLNSFKLYFIHILNILLVLFKPSQILSVKFKLLNLKAVLQFNLFTIVIPLAWFTPIKIKTNLLQLT